MSLDATTRPAKEPLGGSRGDLRRRLLRHHLPLALASGVVLVLFMSVPSFDASKYAMGNLFTEWFPQGRFAEEPAGSHAPAREGEGHNPSMQEGGGHGPSMQEGGGHGPSTQEGGGHTGPRSQGGSGAQGEPHEPAGERGRPSFLGLSLKRLTVGTGYVATGLLALTLLIGPANLLLRRRNPVSTYLTRDVGTWAAVGSFVHVAFGLELHAGITDPLRMFFVDGSPLTNSFGWANWTGLVALVIVAGLFATSSDLALRKLKARRWKRLQRLNYALFALVVAHAFFYGVVLRTDSPYTLLFLLIVVTVFIGQAIGIRLWRRRHARPTPVLT